MFPNQMYSLTRSPTGTRNKLVCHLPRNKITLARPVSGLAFPQTAFPVLKTSGFWLSR